MVNYLYFINPIYKLQKNNVMKKLLFSIVLVVILAVTTNAQVLKTDFFSGYATGVALETNTYTVSGTSTEPLVYNTWSRSRNETNGESPQTIASLTYNGYIVSGQGVAAQLLPLASGLRTSVYSLQTTLGVGTYYLASLFKPTTVESTEASLAEFLSFDTDGKGATLRARVAVKKGSAIGKFNFGINQNNTSANIVWGTTDYDLNATYLIVLKVVIGDPNSISLYINPAKGTEPASADLSGTLSITPPIRGIVLRQRSLSFGGVVGGMVLTSNWADLWDYSTSINTTVSGNEINTIKYYNLSGIEVLKTSGKEVLIEKIFYKNGEVNVKKIQKEIFEY